MPETLTGTLPLTALRDNPTELLQQLHATHRPPHPEKPGEGSQAANSPEVLARLRAARRGDRFRKPLPTVLTVQNS